MEFNKDAHTDHISQQFKQELEAIKSHLMTMGGAVEKQLNDAVNALLDGDSEQSERAQKTDKQINDWEVEIEEQCTQIIARRQPAASDLRLIMAVSRAVNDLERIGDEAARIAQHDGKLVEEGESPRGYSETRHISGLIREMLANYLNAFARYDTDLAYKVAKMDREVDEEYKSAMRSLATYTMEDPRSITRILNIIWVLRSLDRIGDHSRTLYPVKSRPAPDLPSQRHQRQPRLLEGDQGDPGRVAFSACPMREGWRGSITRILNIIWVLCSLERIGDHSRMIYQVKSLPGEESAST